MGIRGVTVSDVRGFGAQGGSTERQAGKFFALWKHHVFHFPSAGYWTICNKRIADYNFCK